MAWYVSLFLAIVGLCAVGYAVMLLRDLLAPRQSSKAVVRKRYTEEFPMSTGLVRRNRKERFLEFEMESGAKVTLSVDEDYYGQCPMGTVGNLIWKGSRLVSFEPTSMPEK